MSNGHSHAHSHSHAHNHGADESTKNIMIAFCMNFGFAIIEIIGGFITNSTAILSDAVHDFGDSLSLGLSLIFQKLSTKTPTEKYSYGFKRLPVIGAIVNIAVLLIGTIFVFQEAIQRFFNPRTVMAEGMFLMAILGIVANGISVLRMKGSKRILDKTVMMHLLEDLLGWIAVFAVSIVMYFTKWYLLDPILSLIICAIILRNIIINVKATVEIIMGATTDMELYTHIKAHVAALSPDISAINSINMWSLDGEENVVAMQIAVSPNADTNTLLKAIKATLIEENVEHSTIEFVTTGVDL